MVVFYINEKNCSEFVEYLCERVQCVKEIDRFVNRLAEKFSVDKFDEFSDKLKFGQNNRFASNIFYI